MDKKYKILSCRPAYTRVIYDLRDKEGCAVYRIGGKGQEYYSSLDDELVNIFNQYCLTPDKRKDRRLMFTYRNLEGKQYHLFAHDLAYGVYSGMIKCESFYNDVREYFARKGDLTVDHADGNVFNITKNNLSWMTKSENIRKGNVTRKLKMPEKLVIAYDGSGYLMELTTLVNIKDQLAERVNSITVSIGGIPYKIRGVQIPDNTVSRICVRVNTPEELIQKIIELTNSNMSWREPLRKNNRWVELPKKGETMVDVTIRSINEQKRLLSEPKSIINE